MWCSDAVHDYHACTLHMHHVRHAIVSRNMSALFSSIKGWDITEETEVDLALSFMMALMELVLLRISQALCHLDYLPAPGLCCHFSKAFSHDFQQVTFVRDLSL